MVCLVSCAQESKLEFGSLSNTQNISGETGPHPFPAASILKEGLINNTRQETENWIIKKLSNEDWKFKPHLYLVFVKGPKKRNN